MNDQDTDHGQLDRDGFDRDDDLRVLLAAHDPASSLPPADPAGVARLLEDIMNDETDTAVPTTTRRRNPFVWVAAAAAAVLVVGVGATAVSGLDKHPDAHLAGKTPSLLAPAAVPATGTLSLTYAGGPAKCALPSADVLKSRDVAFQGKVVSIAHGMVTLEPSTFYAGKPVASVKVQVPIVTPLGEGLTFVVGKSYLVSASQGQVGVCGYSGLATSQTQHLYDQAFN